MSHQEQKIKQGSHFSCKQSILCHRGAANHFLESSHDLNCAEILEFNLDVNCWEEMGDTCIVDSGKTNQSTLRSPLKLTHYKDQLDYMFFWNPHDAITQWLWYTIYKRHPVHFTARTRSIESYRIKSLFQHPELEPCSRCCVRPCMAVVVTSHPGSNIKHLCLSGSKQLQLILKNVALNSTTKHTLERSL